MVGRRETNFSPNTDYSPIYIPLRHRRLSSYPSFLRSLEAPHAQPGIEAVHFQFWGRRVHPSQDVKLGSKNALYPNIRVEEGPTAPARSRLYSRFLVAVVSMHRSSVAAAGSNAPAKMVTAASIRILERAPFLPLKAAVLQIMSFMEAATSRLTILRYNMSYQI